MRESRKNPFTAAVLNFSFWGLGYVYIDEGLGAVLVIHNIILGFSLAVVSFSAGFMAKINSIFYAFGAFEWALSSSLFIISAILAWHAYEMTKEKNKAIFT
jgi:hypothetical protein